MATKKYLPRVFIDLDVGGMTVGRVVFELFTNHAPKTCENFRSLCTGDKGVGQTTGKALHYKNSIFHRVVKDFMIQGGDFSASNGTGGESIYGGTFDDEDFTVKHDKQFLLSMANRGKNTNGSQFFITHVVFGRVVSGFDVITLVENQPVDRSFRPLQDVKIVNCGELVLKTRNKGKAKAVAKDSDASDSDTDSSSESDSDEKRKKRKKSKKKKKDAAKDVEDGEVDEVETDTLHPLIQVTKIDPDEIPDVPANNFLYRGKRDRERSEEKVERRPRRPIIRGHTRSGRVVKGRGTFRYRTPSRSRSRSRSETPPHWRRELGRTIKFREFKKREEAQKEREEELRRREEARKQRHKERDMKMQEGDRDKERGREQGRQKFPEENTKRTVELRIADSRKRYRSRSADRITPEQEHKKERSEEQSKKKKNNLSESEKENGATVEVHRTEVRSDWSDDGKKSQNSNRKNTWESPNDDEPDERKRSVDKSPVEDNKKEPKRKDKDRESQSKSDERKDKQKKKKRKDSDSSDDNGLKEKIAKLERLANELEEKKRKVILEQDEKGKREKDKGHKKSRRRSSSSESDDSRSRHRKRSEKSKERNKSSSRRRH